MKTLMKALCFAALLMVSASASAADGQINFFTFNGDTSRGQVFDTGGAPLPGGSTYLGQLYGSTSSNPNSFVSLDSPASVAGSGYFNDGTVLATGVSPGTSFFYQLRVWNSAAGGSFEAASIAPNGIIGSSQVINVTLGGTEGANVFTVPQANGFLSFQLAAVPEPSTIALGVLGGLVLLFRRRK